MGEAFIVRKGGVTSEATAAPTITIVSETPTDVTFTLTNNDDNTALITYEIDGNRDVVSLAAAATSSNITVALAVGTYTLTAFATVVGEVASQSTAAVEIIVIPAYELLYDSLTANAGSPITLPVTEIDITGLSIGKDDTLRLVYTVVGGSSTTNFLSIRANNITSNYTRQILFGNGTGISAGRFTDSIVTETASNNKSVGFADIKVSNNDRFVCQSQFASFVGSDSSGIRNLNFNIVNTDTVTSITSIKVIGNRTNEIATGSRIQLYKVTEAA